VLDKAAYSAFESTLNSPIVLYRIVASTEQFCLISLKSCPLVRLSVDLIRTLAECRMGRLNQGSFVLLYFVLFVFSGLCLVFVAFVPNLSSVLYFPAYTDLNGTDCTTMY